MRLPALLVLLLLSVLATSSSYATTLTVTKIADTNDGVCDADCSFREAINTAASGDTIAFAELFSSPQKITLQLGQIEFSTSLAISGPGRDLLTVSGGNVTRIFKITGGAVVEMSRLTLSEARITTLDSYGGAVYLANSTLTLSDARLSDNYTRFDGPPFVFGYGAAVYCDSGRLNIYDSMITNNTAPGGIVTSQLGVVSIRGSSFEDNGGTAVVGIDNDSIDVSKCTFLRNRGGIAFGSNSHATLENSLVSNNSVAGVSVDLVTTAVIRGTIISDNNPSGIANATGGGLFNKGTTTLDNCVITGNKSNSKGGGIWNAGNLYVLDSSLTGNTAQDSGGGVWNARTAYFTNTTLSGNMATRSTSVGGGIHNLADGGSPNSKIYLTNSTLADNRAGLKGGGIRSDGVGMVYSSNSIIANNISLNTSERDVSGSVTSSGYNVVGSAFGSSGWIASDLLDRDPLIGPLANNGGITMTHALLEGSPAINAGSNARAVDPQTMLPLKTDQRGWERFFSGIVDIGAYESTVALQLVAIGGRVHTPNGRGMPNTRITLDDGTDDLIYTQTNSSGYYRFVNVAAGRTYTITASHKVFALDPPITLAINNSRDDLDFIAAL